MEHGTVTTVVMDQGIVYCNVEPLRYNTEYEGLPVLKSHSGFVKMPRQGDIVLIDKLQDGSRFIQNVLSNEEVHNKPEPVPSELKEGELTLRLDRKTELTFSITPDQKYNIEIRASKDIDIEADRDLTIEAGRDIELDAANDVIIQGIPFMDHVHGYEDDTEEDTSDGSGSTTTTQKTSDTPEEQ